MNNILDTTILENIIIGRVEPYIYAFSTNTIPNYLKVGDTFRGVNVRIGEWKKYYPDLNKEFESSAMLEDGTKYFRDFSVHQFLENEKKYKRLKENEIKEVTYYSREFFMNATIKDIEEAIIDIKNDYVNSSQKYQFYNVDSRLAEEQIYERNQDYEPRPNQQVTIDKFEQAVKNGRNNLLMYAIMRFGKSFTSMCCANKMNAKFVVIVSAKADVKEEWKKTVQSHILFKDYKFLSVADLNRNDNIIKNVFDGKIEGKTKVAVFLTLQDLQGKNIKNKHKEVFENKIDLLIIDETHFGARAEKYGQVLDDKALSQDNKKAQDDDSVSIEDAEKQIKILDAKIKLHLSGTPYRILMGNEFKEEDIIAFYQFTDIVDDQKKWIDDNNDKPEDVQKEDWENPYYGFPQMIRFAFNPNESSRKRLEELKKNGVSYAFSELMKPKSISKSDNNDHKIFVYEKEIKELLEVIDGTREDNELLGFLNYDKIKNGKMCRHIVMVLPYRASCDAMEELIRKTKLPRIGEYEIINISGVENPKLYKKVSDIKSKISELEKENKKTITLTVNRMLTGSTVPEWDTMLYFKDTSSAQEYDQAIFRLQNQYIKTCKTEDEKSEIKINMKPQTLLVDFLPLRMFQMQEKKAQIYNVNTDEGGNNKLKERITKELEISPIIAVNKNKIVQVESSDILEAISGYKMNKGIKDEAFDIPVDLKILDNITIKNVISNENELDSKSGLKIQAYIKDTNIDGDLDITISKNNNDINDDNQNTNMPSNDQNEKESWEKKIQSYYAKILFFAFLTSDKVISLKDILDNLSKADNKRIACNLGLNGKVLKAIYDYYYKNDKFILSVLDYKIQDLSNLSHKDLELEEKLNVAMSKFGKLGSSVVITPSNICDDMVNLLPDDAFKDNKRFLDIAGVYGEFAIAIVKKYKNLNNTDYGFENLIYTIPKNSICYELTRKVYEMLDLNTNNIATFYSEDILKLKKKVKSKTEIDYDMIKNIVCQNKPFNEIKTSDKVEEGATMCEFNTVLGNPPYQLETENWDSKTNGQARRSNIFHHFQLSADRISSDYEVLIYPGKRWWHCSGKGVEEFGREQINDPFLEKVVMYADAGEVFSSVQIADGVSIVLKNRNNKKNNFEYIYFDKTNKNPVMAFYEKPGENLIPLNPKDANIVNSVSNIVNRNSFKYLFDRILSQKLYGIESDFVELNPEKVKILEDGREYDWNKYVKLYANDRAGKAGRTKWFVTEKSNIPQSQELISQWQVVVSSANAGGQKRDNQIEIIDNHSVFGRSRVALGSFKTEQEAKNFYNYCNTKLIKFMFLMTDEALTSLGKKVPDILDYTDNNKFVDFNSDLDSQLFSLFEISLSEQDYIKRVIDAK